MIELLDFFIQNNFVFGALQTQSHSFSQTQVNSFKLYLEESQNKIDQTQLFLNTASNGSNTNVENNRNMNSQRKTLNDIDPLLFTNFNDSKDFISSLFNKKLRYENHIKIFKTHIENGTTPSSLFFNKFPRPLLSDDHEFVEEHNNLIKDFTMKNMQLCENFLNKRVITIDTKLGEIKSNLSHCNSSQDFNPKFDQLFQNNQKSLEETFRKANEKALRCKSVPFIAGKRFKRIRFNNNNNTVYSNQSLTSNNSLHSFNTSFRSNSSRRYRSPIRNNNNINSNLRQREHSRSNNNRSSDHSYYRHNTNQNSSRQTNNFSSRSIIRNGENSRNNNSNFNPYQRNRY